MIPVLNLVVYVCVSFVAGICTSSFHVSACLLGGLHSYLYPNASPGQEMQSGAAAFKNAKNRDGQDNQIESTDREKSYVVLRRTDPKRKEKQKEKFRWEEGCSQIYRLNLSRTQLMGRLYFAEYDEVVVYSVVGIAVLFSWEVLSHASHFLQMESSARARKFDLVPFLLGGFAVYKVVHRLAQVAWQSSTSRVSELMLSIAVGFIGFFIALGLLFCAPSLLLNSGMEILLSPGFHASVGRDASMIPPMVLRAFMALISGLVTGLLLVPAHRVARSFWLGTDQLCWNIPMAKWGLFVRFLLHLNIVVPLVSALIWIKPMASLFVISKVSGPKGHDVVADGNADGVQAWGSFLLPVPSDDWAQDFGVLSDSFGRVQFWGLCLAGLLHLALFRVHVQTYLNEALIVWYEGLHRSKVMNLELVNAKLLLNSYFLCRAAVQFFVPGVLVTLLLGMSRIWGDIPLSDLAETSPNLFLLRVVALFTGWWVVFSQSILTCAILSLYRAGFLLAS